MSTPPAGERRRPRATADAARAARAAIVERRTAADDPDLARLPDDPYGVLRYVAAHCDPRKVGQDVIRADVDDAATIADHLTGDVDRLHAMVIRGGRRAGMSWGEIAAAEGLRDRRYAHDLLARLEAGVAGLIKRGTAIRSKRAGDAEEERLRVAEARRVAASTAADAALRRWVAALYDARGPLPDDLYEDVIGLYREATPRAEMGYGELVGVARGVAAGIGKLGLAPDTPLHALYVEGVQLVKQ